MEVQPVPQIQTEQVVQTIPSQQTSQITCQFCGSVIGPTVNFCPVCGKQIKEQPLSLGRKIYIYAVSLALPPLGLIWTFKYLKKDAEYKRVAIIAAVLTIISIVATIWFSLGFINSVQQQLNQFQNLGL